MITTFIRAATTIAGALWPHVVGGRCFLPTSSRKYMGALLAFSLGAPALVVAQEVVRFDYAGFASLPGATAFGSATPVVTADGTVMRFSNCGQTSASGAVRLNSFVPLGTFSMELSWRISCPGGIVDASGQPGGDGFLVAFSPTNTSYPATTDWSRFIGLPNSMLRVFFDTYQNAGELSTNMITVGQFGPAPSPVTSVNVPGRFDDGARWYAWITFDGANFEVRVSQSPVPPIAPQLVQPLNESLRFGLCDAVVATSAFVGGANGRYELISWKMASGPFSLSASSGQANCIGGDAGFSVTPSGTGPFTYQWRKDTIAIDPLANPSAATATLTLINISDADVASYDCIVTNTCGSVTSNAATLNICRCLTCAADFNEDGGVDGEDVSAFFAAWESGICDADVNQDGGVDGDDVGVFFADWEAGGC